MSDAPAQEPRRSARNRNASGSAPELVVEKKPAASKKRANKDPEEEASAEVGANGASE